jgi:hypothetical protein
MNKPFSLVLLVSGVLALGYGITASKSIGSDFSRLFTGAPTDKAIWLLIAGAAAIVAGLSGLLRGSKAP